MGLILRLGGVYETRGDSVRRIQIGHYEMRYEIVDATIYLLRLWHTREDR